jgi:hypothetical protein
MPVKRRLLPAAPVPVVPEPGCETPAHPNVKQAARHFGTTPAAFRQLAIREGFKRVRIGNKHTYDLKEMDEWVGGSGEEKQARSPHRSGVASELLTLLKSPSVL